jgi:glutathione-independent formaldehyde dehydrogenase
MRYNRWPRDLIICGQARPSQIISHELPLEEAVRAYDQLDKCADG